MNLRSISTFLFALALSSATFAQDASPQRGMQNPGGMSGQRGAAGMGRSITGTVTEVAADHYTIKTMTGETYAIRYSADTRFMKQAAGVRGEGGMRGQRNGQDAGQDGGQGRGTMGGGNANQSIKPTDIKNGDVIAALGDTDSAANSVSATTILQIDPERARQMQQMQANYGKTWLMGKVTAIDGVQVTIAGSLDNAPHAFAADENTTFRERRDPITLADVHVGDNVRVDGAVKDGIFIATTVNVVTPPAETPRLPRNGPQPQ